MSIEKKQFSVALLKIENTPFTLDMFSSIPKEDTDNLEIDGKVQHNRIIKKEIKNNRFILFYFEDGSVMPRPEVVYNRNTHIDENNPRSEDQIERDSQTFVLIDTETQKIFISDFRKKKILEKWISEKIKKTVLIKNIIDRENFLNELQSVGTIYLSAIPNLFSSMGILSHELTKDHHNYGVRIKHIGVKISFGENSLPEVFKNKILDWFKQYDNSSIQKLEVSGRYDEKFERVFNADGIIDKITIEVTLEEDGLFDPEQIFNNLIQKIK